MNYGYMDYQEWCNEMDQEEKKKKEEEKKLMEKRKLDNENNLKEFKEKFGDFWYCENIDTWIPLNIKKIESIDKINFYYLMGYLNTESAKQPVAESLVGAKPMPEPYTIEEYHEKFCYFDEQQKKWIYKNNDN